MVEWQSKRQTEAETRRKNQILVKLNAQLIVIKFSAFDEDAKITRGSRCYRDWLSRLRHQIL